MLLLLNIALRARFKPSPEGLAYPFPALNMALPARLKLSPEGRTKPFPALNIGLLREADGTFLTGQISQSGAVKNTEIILLLLYAVIY